MHDVRTLSTSNLCRLLYRVWDRMTAGDGYQPFGYDRRTLAITCPGWLAILDSVNSELNRR